MPINQINLMHMDTVQKTLQIGCIQKKLNKNKDNVAIPETRFKWINGVNIVFTCNMQRCLAWGELMKTDFKFTCKYNIDSLMHFYLAYEQNFAFWMWNHFFLQKKSLFLKRGFSIDAPTAIIINEDFPKIESIVN